MTNALSAAPRPEEAALLFLKGQYALRYHDERKGTLIKMLSPEWVRSAFSKIPLDSGWPPRPSRRCAPAPAVHRVCSWGMFSPAWLSTVIQSTGAVRHPPIVMGPARRSDGRPTATYLPKYQSL
jgi:hypothetical protein